MPLSVSHKYLVEYQGSLYEVFEKEGVFIGTDVTDDVEGDLGEALRGRE